MSPTATKEEIKLAYRERAKETHPDLSKQEDPREFLEVQEAYEILTGRARGKEVSRVSEGHNWDWHDWYWQFRVSHIRQRKEGDNPAHSPTVCSHNELRSQMAGLRQRSAIRTVKSRTSANKACTGTSSFSDEELRGQNVHTTAVQDPCAPESAPKESPRDAECYASEQPSDCAAADPFLFETVQSDQKPKFHATSEVRSNIVTQLAGLKRKVAIKSTV